MSLFAASVVVHSHSLTWLSGTCNRMEPLLTLLVKPVFSLLREYKLSAVKSFPDPETEAAKSY